MSKERSLEGHNLIKSLLTNLQPVLKAAVKEMEQRATKTGTVGWEGDMSLWRRYSYYYDVFYYSSSLLEAIRKMKDAETYLLRFPQPRTYEKHGLTEDRWVEYHYSNCVTTIVGLYDIALILTNIVFRLGIPPRQCKDDIILRNEWVERTQVKLALDRLNKLVQPFREPRNLHLHQGKMPRLKRNEFDMLKTISLAQRHSPQSFPLASREVVDLAYDEESSAIRSNLETKREEFQRAILGLFDALLPIYEAHAKLLQSSDTASTP